MSPLSTCATPLVSDGGFSVEVIPRDQKNECLCVLFVLP